MCHSFLSPPYLFLNHHKGEIPGPPKRHKGREPPWIKARSLLGGDTPSSDIKKDSRDESDFPSDEEIEEILVPEQSAQLFKAEDYPCLLSKAIAALKRNIDPGAGTTSSATSILRSKVTDIQEFFPKNTLQKKVFPFPVFLNKNYGQSRQNQWPISNFHMLLRNFSPLLPMPMRLCRSRLCSCCGTSVLWPTFRGWLRTQWIKG